MAFLVLLLFANFFIFSLVHLYKKLQSDPENYHNQAFLCALCLTAFALCALWCGFSLYS